MKASKVDQGQKPNIFEQSLARIHKSWREHDKEIEANGGRVPDVKPTPSSVKPSIYKDTEPISASL